MGSSIFSQPYGSSVKKTTIIMKGLFIQWTCNSILILHENIFVAELVYSIIFTVCSYSGLYSTCFILLVAHRRTQDAIRKTFIQRCLLVTMQLWRRSRCPFSSVKSDRLVSCCTLAFLCIIYHVWGCFRPILAASYGKNLTDLTG